MTKIMRVGKIEFRATEQIRAVNRRRRPRLAGNSDNYDDEDPAVEEQERARARQSFGTTRRLSRATVAHGGAE